MSEHESFAEAVEAVREEYRGNAFVEIPVYKLFKAINRLQAAHDRDMEAAYDPRRLRSSKDKSEFALAMEALREFRWQHATNDQEAIPYINAVEEAHRREVAGYLAACDDCDQSKWVGKHEYHRGYTDGLRKRETETWHLDEERSEAVHRLREMPDVYPGSAVPWHRWYRDFAHALSIDEGIRSFASVRDRLVRLLGGDQSQDAVSMRPENETGSECNFSAPKNDMDASDADERPAETTNDEGDHVSLGTHSHLPQSPNKAIKDSEPDGEFAKNGINPQFETITTDLRNAMWSCMDGGWLTIEKSAFNAVAGRIDVAVTELQHDVEMWRDRAEDMRTERDEADLERDYWKQANTDTMNLADQMEHERDDAERELELAKRMYAKVCEDKCKADAEVARLKRAAERDADVMEALNLQLEEVTAERDELQSELGRTKELLETSYAKRRAFADRRAERSVLEERAVRSGRLML